MDKTASSFHWLERLLYCGTSYRLWNTLEDHNRQVRQEALRSLSLCELAHLKQYCFVVYHSGDLTLCLKMLSSPFLLVTKPLEPAQIQDQLDLCPEHSNQAEGHLGCNSCS